MDRKKSFIGACVKQLKNVIMRLINVLSWPIHQKMVAELFDTFA